MAKLCMSLAPDEASLKAWCRDHAALIDAMPDEIFNPIRSARAERLGELKETER